MTDTAVNFPENQLVVGDCIDRMASWPAGGVDLVFADPPYNIGYGYDRYDDNRSDDEYIAWTGRWIDESVRLEDHEGFAGSVH